jgi:THUMP domain-like
VKCSPGIDFAGVRAMGFDGEVQITSWAGSVREACLWPKALSQPDVSRRAVLLDGNEQVTDADPADSEIGPAGKWIVDPDGAVVRAGLVRQYAARHGLWQLDPDIAYLSGDHLPPGVRGFEVLEELSFGEKGLRRELEARGCGTLEILVRGVGVDPDALRRRLRLRGGAALSVVIMRIGAGPISRPVVYICRASR